MFLSGRRRLRAELRKFGLAFVVALAAVFAISTPGASYGKESKQALGTVSWSELPAEAQATEKLIRAGGPFPYAKDGTTFANRERILPMRSRGYYREYTVKTPGARDRGARRIVCGGAAAQPDACFYTADHYASFRRIVH